MAGWRVLTWPPAIGSAPVSSETDRTSIPSAARASRVPSVAITSTPRAIKSRAKGTIPSRLATESRARTWRTSKKPERPAPGSAGSAESRSGGRAPGPFADWLPEWIEYTVRSWHTPHTQYRRRAQRCWPRAVDERLSRSSDRYLTEHSEGPRERPVESTQYAANRL